MLSPAVIQTSLVCIPISGETVVIRHKPGALVGSSVCAAPVGCASPAETERLMTEANRLGESRGLFNIVPAER